MFLPWFFYSFVIFIYENQVNQPLATILSGNYFQWYEQDIETYTEPKKAYMRLARNGNAQFEVNSGLLEGTSKEHAQGDPKSSFGFNVSSNGPLNHSPNSTMQINKQVPSSFSKFCLLYEVL